MFKPIPLTEEQVKHFLAQYPGWLLLNNKLHRDYVFADFNQAFAFMTLVAAQAEVMNHHPEWFNVYNRLSVDLTTHDAQAITLLDRELAIYMEKTLSNI